jgi:general secretion pathway protein K
MEVILSNHLRNLQQQRPQRQQGVALIMVLLVVALVTVLAVQLSERLQVNVLRSTNYQQSEQGYWYWLSAEEIARKLLELQVRDSQGVIHQEQVWYQQTQEGTSYPIEGGGLAQVAIKDLQGCFNMNALKGDGLTNEQLVRRKVQLRMLLLALEIEIDEYTADVIVESVADWLDTDERMNSGYGAERGDYESLEVPYLAANDYFVHESELRLVKGISQPVYQALRPHICVIPNSGKHQVNINTLTPEQAPLLHALMLGAINVDTAVSALNERPDDGYENMEDAQRSSTLAQAAQQQIQPNFGAVPLPNGVTVETIGGMFDDLSTKSNYFALDTRVSVGDLIFRGQSKLYVASDDSEVLLRGLGEP